MTTSPLGSPVARRTPVGPAGRDRDRRHQRLLAGVLLVLAGAAGVGLVGSGTPSDPGVPRPAASGTGSGGSRADGGGAGHRSALSPSTTTDYPSTGPGVFTIAPGRSPVHGTAGPLHRYRVAVERDTGQAVAAFADAVDEVLADPASWIGSGQLRVQRVPVDDVADFTVYLATPATSERMCAVGGLSTEGYTSCRLPGQVIINLARWQEAVPDYGASLAVYRTYVINHEVGHEFGEQHEACPGPGRPAPVMQQQTYGLQGCVANPWPHLDGHRYVGPPVP